MRTPDLLATRKGRLTAFFLLYVTEGVPLGFAAVAVATQLRRMGVGPAEIGAFVAAFYLPWAFKWAVGPVVDVFRSRRFGHRRAWILLTQVMMASTVLMLLWVPLPQSLGLFTAILLVHNSFGATQDVAIDALACNTLSEDERGLANGLMFAGASIGQAIGGAGVLFLAGYAGFESGFVLVAATILAVTTFVVLPLKEAYVAPSAATTWRHAVSDMRDFVQQSMRAFLGSRGAFAGVLHALLPCGAMSLSLALQSNLAVELGMNDDQVAVMSLVTNLCSGASMVIGGLLADRLGRRRMLALYVVLMALPVLYLAATLQAAGYVLPRPPGGAAMPGLVTQLWLATTSFSVALGLMYGTRAAVFMDITNPRVAATQFTAYMAMMNVAIAFAATWQGLAIEALGYPLTLLIDALFGLVSLSLLPLLKAPLAGSQGCDALAQGRARRAAQVLALACAAFAPWWLLHDAKGASAGLTNTLFTLVFVCSALFLLAGTLLQPMPTRWRRSCRWMALGMLLLYLRRFIEPDDGLVLRVAVGVVAAAGALLLWRLSSVPWPGLAVDGEALINPPATLAPARAAAWAPGPAGDRESRAD